MAARKILSEGSNMKVKKTFSERIKQLESVIEYLEIDKRRLQTACSEKDHEINRLNQKLLQTQNQMHQWNVFKDTLKQVMKDPEIERPNPPTWIGNGRA
jgi:predicted RNase H-like nuclease (RuvC/YqgF family)